MIERFLATGWEFCRAGESDWKQARVPGCVHDDLIRHGVIADPFYRMNERECAWVDDCDWVYRCRFDWSPVSGCPKRVLRFEGLDTVCTVFLNGEKIASHDNMFLPLEVDVTTLLRPANELRIEFSSAVRVANERRSRYLAQEGIDPSVTTFYERSFVRKAQYMFGWDWGPRLVSCGVWKPVSLLEYGSRVTDVWCRPKLVDGEWLVDVSWEGERLSTPDIMIHEKGAEVAHCMDYGALLRVTEPKLWWPSDFRDYKTNHRSETYSGRIAFGEDTSQFGFGLRTVDLVRKPDKWGESFEFVVNGENVFGKGANWIPADTFAPRLTHDDYERLIRDSAAAHMNMLLVDAAAPDADQVAVRSLEQLEGARKSILIAGMNRVEGRPVRP